MVQISSYVVFVFSVLMNLPKSKINAYFQNRQTIPEIWRK